jgi:hypothetical protein
VKLPVSHVLAAAALALTTAAGAPTAQPARAPGNGWTAMQLPASVARPAVLNSIAAASRTLAWAVGTEDVSAAGRPLLLEWNGRRWTKDAVPGKPRVGQMVQVSSATPGTAWALGYVGADGSTLIVRWTRSAWVSVPVPRDLQGQTVYTIAAGTGGTAWLYGITDTQRNVLERWTRDRWQAINVPENLWGDVEGMLATGSRDLWLNDYTDQGDDVIARYDAGRWTSIGPPPGGVTFVSGFLPVTARSVWVTGYLCTAVEPEAGCTASEPLIAHWNGSAWNRVLHPEGAAFITSISPNPSGQPLWAGVSVSGTREPLVYAHFNGKTWSLERAGAATRGIVTTSTFVAAVPGTNATWAITDRQADASAPGVTALAYNAGR